MQTQGVLLSGISITSLPGAEWTAGATPPRQGDKGAVRPRLVPTGRGRSLWLDVMSRRPSTTPVDTGPLAPGSRGSSAPRPSLQSGLDLDEQIHERLPHLRVDEAVIDHRLQRPSPALLTTTQRTRLRLSKRTCFIPSGATLAAAIRSRSRFDSCFTVSA